MRGITKCFSNIDKKTPNEIIQYVTERQDEEFACRNIDFKNLFGRPLQLIDCQNIFCEIDKYARASNPELTVGGRSKIKQKFSLNKEKLSLYFPEKWEINENIPKDYKT